MNYDTNARRDTPLALKLKLRIAQEGPLSVEDYMHACLYDPEHGYYVKRPAIGAGGDFITAPEISQVFGELIGLWCAIVWQQMGAPVAFDLVEYGPGRGTLMADALRALRKVPACHAAASIRMVEVSPALREIQQRTLAGVCERITWHEQLRDEIEQRPAIVLANEVLDAEPVVQLVGIDIGQAGVRCVDLDGEGNLQFCTRNVGGRSAAFNEPATAISEVRDLHPLVQRDLSGNTSLAALFTDYGHINSVTGDTLQAVRAHRFEHPLTSPGEADLTAQVDFELFARQACEVGFAVDGPVTQAEFLGALGIAERASRLMAANPGRAGEIEIGIARLMSPTGMGNRFKAIGLRSPGLPPLPALYDRHSGERSA